MMKRATELEFFKWFYFKADFGPADSDVRDSMIDEFVQEKDMNMPKGYENYSDGETSSDK